MEDLISWKKLEENKSLVVGRIFTRLQFGILAKRIQGKALDSNEKTYYYKYIKPKVKVMLLFSGVEQTHMCGKEHILQERIPLAAKILAAFSKKHKNQKIMISGSFLFSKKYNDIDVFIFSKYNKEDYKKGKVHVNYLPESALDSLFFSSLQQISIRNFAYTPKKEFTLNIEDILQLYELLINYILNKKECAQELRQFFLETEYFSKKVILNPKQLYTLKEIIAHKNMITLLSDTLVNALAYGASGKKLCSNLAQHIQDYKGLLKEYKNAKNIRVYIKTYQEAIEIAA